MTDSVESIAAGLEASVAHMERSLGIKMDSGRLKEACALSNEARDLAVKCNHLRFTSPPLMRGSEAILFAIIFSQLWGKRELVELQRTLLEELSAAKESVEREIGIDDTHRLVWLHLPPFYSSRLMDFIELTCNAPVVFEEVNFVGWQELDPEDPYRSLARKLLTVGFLDPEFRATQLRKYAPEAKITGFLLYNHMFGRCSMADSCFTKRLRDELQAVGIPLLVLDGDCLDETIDPCSTTTKVQGLRGSAESEEVRQPVRRCRQADSAPHSRAATQGGVTRRASLADQSLGTGGFFAKHAPSLKKNPAAKKRPVPFACRGKEGDAHAFSRCPTWRLQLARAKMPPIPNLRQAQRLFAGRSLVYHDDGRPRSVGREDCDAHY